MYRWKGQTWDEDQLSNMVWDSVVESTECLECGYSTSLEPDAHDVSCTDCKRGKIHSPLVVLGIM